METQYFAYIRCSTVQQSYDRQYKQLKDFTNKEKISIPQENIVEEKRSGKNKDRPKFKALVTKLKELEAKGVHCCLVLVDLSRMGRSYEVTKRTWNELTSAGVDIVVTSFPILDTRSNAAATDLTSALAEGKALKAMLIDIVFNVLNYLTQQELQEKSDRCNAGRAAAKDEADKKGEKKFGRKKMTFDDLPKEFLKVMKQAKGKERKNDLLRLVNGRLVENGKKQISRVTFYNYLNLYKQGKQV